VSDVDIDTAIAAFLEHGDEQSKQALVATGEDGLRRMLHLWFDGGNRSPESVIPPLSSRWLVDQWTQCLAILARVAPDVYVTSIAGKKLGTLEVSILGGLSTQAAVDEACRHVHDDEWLVRSSAVEALIRQGHPSGRRCIEEALSDPVLVVATRATKGLSRWNPQAALDRYTQLLDTPLTPVLRTEVMSAIRALRAGQVVRDLSDIAGTGPSEEEVDRVAQLPLAATVQVRRWRPPLPRQLPADLCSSEARLGPVELLAGGARFTSITTIGCCRPAKHPDLHIGQAVKVGLKRWQVVQWSDPGGVTPRSQALAP